MKRIFTFIALIGLVGCATVNARMSNTRLRAETRFLTDKMAYELNLNVAQYNDIYEINYDFISSIGGLLDNMERDEAWALDDYYEALDLRNDDLRFVLSGNQFRRFIGIDYFCRPLYVNNGRWGFRVYVAYTNPDFFYWGRPTHYLTYCGEHYRRTIHCASHYRGRHPHLGHYSEVYRIRGHRSYDSYCRSDFGRTVIHVTPPSRRPSYRYDTDHHRHSRDNRIYRDNRNSRDNGSSRDHNYQKSNGNDHHRRESNSRAYNDSRGRTVLQTTSYSNSRSGSSSSRSEGSDRSRSEIRGSSRR